MPFLGAYGNDKKEKIDDPIKYCGENIEKIESAAKTYSANSGQAYISDKSIGNLPFDETKGLLELLGEKPHYLHKKAQQQLSEKFVCPLGGHYFVTIIGNDVNVRCDKHGDKKGIKKLLADREKKNQIILISVIVVVLIFFFILFR
jgi:hypothetical protein